MKICKNCGAEIQDGAAFCTHCGTKVEEQRVEEQRVEPEKTEQAAQPVEPEQTSGPVSYTHLPFLCKNGIYETIYLCVCAKLGKENGGQ